MLFKKKCYTLSFFNQIVFCNYNLNATQGLDFNYVDENLIKSIRNMGFLFIRKIGIKSFVYKNIF